jgi:hypothetical protein
MISPSLVIQSVPELADQIETVQGDSSLAK